MKSILSLIIGGALVVSGFGQTRNVLVGTNSAVVQPTNFWSADAVNARAGLGLGAAATNPASAFQPSSLNLSNLAANNAGSLTNLNATNIVGLIPASNIPSVTLTNIGGTLPIIQGGTGATNAATARQNLGSTTVGDAVFIATNAAEARTTLGATIIGANIFTLTNPDEVRFIRLNANNTVSSLSATDFRTALSIGTNLGTVTSIGLTVPSFLSVSTPTITSSGTFAITLGNQTSRHAFIAPNGGGVPTFRALESDDLPSLAIAKITGLQTALDGKLSTTGTAALATNVTGIVSLANGGTGATNAASARTALGATTIGSELLTLINPSAIRFIRLNADNTATALSDSDFRTAIGLGTAATNLATAFQPASTNLTTLSANNGSGLTNLALSNVVGLQSALDGKLATNGNAINLTNFPTVGLASNVSGVVAITNGGSGATTAGGARTNLELGVTNAVQFGSLVVTNAGASATLTVNGGLIFAGSPAATAAALTRTNLGLGFSGLTNTNAETFRTSIGLGWSALTNTTASGFQASLFGANTNPVLVNTNGEVVSPTNFWQVAPITTTFIESQPVTNSSTNITAARFLHIHSLATNIANVTNTINLPTNGATFNGDIALVVHQGPTNSMTKVRTAGSTNDLVTMTRFDEAVEFVYYNGVWEFNHNLSFIEPIYFSGTNAAANAAASRTNLGLGTTNDVHFNGGRFDSGVAIYGPTNVVIDLSTNEAARFRFGINFYTTNAAATTRTNLGLGANNEVTFGTINSENSIRVVSGTNTFVSLADDVNEFFSSTEFNGQVNFNEDVYAGYIELSTGSNTVDLQAFGIGFAGSAAANTRFNLGIPLPALTNTSNVTFQSAVFTTNTAPTNTANVNSVGFNTAVKWMEITLNISGTNQVFRIPLFQ
jgi:hypothetical protein